MKNSNSIRRDMISYLPPFDKNKLAYEQTETQVFYDDISIGVIHAFRWISDDGKAHTDFHIVPRKDTNKPLWNVNRKYKKQSFSTLAAAQKRILQCCKVAWEERGR